MARRLVPPREATEVTLPSGIGDGARDGAGPWDPRRRWWPSPAGVAARVTVLVLLGIVLLAIPHVIPPVQVNVAARAAIFGIVALSMNVLLGYAGQISLGHQAFVGVGAFTAAYVLSQLAMPYAVALLAAVGTGAVAALVLGGIALRIRGLHLALVTIAYGLFAQEVIFNIRALTGGGAGQRAPRPDFVSGDIAYVYFCMAMLALVWLFDWRLTSSKAGRAIQALRDDERVAASWGINVTGYKLLAFVISGSTAGLAGALFAGVEQVVTPVDFSFTLGLTFVLMTVVGGLRVRSGVVQGGIVFAILPTLLDEAHESWHFFPFTTLDALWEPLIGALLLILTLTLYPGGIAQQQEHLRRWLSFHPFVEHPEVPAAAPVSAALAEADPDEHAEGETEEDARGR